MAERVLGLDIGSSAVKMSQVAITKSGPVLESIVSVPLHPDVVADGLVAEGKENVVSRAIEKAVQEGDFKTDEVVVGLNSSSSVFFRTTSVPVTDPDLLPKVLPNLLRAADDQLNPSEVSIDYAVLGPSPDSQGRDVDLVLFVVRDDYAENLCQIVENAGLNIVGCDVSALATLRAVSIGEHHQGSSALVDIGSDLMTILIHRNGVPRFIELDPAIGGQRASEVIAETINEKATAADIEKFKTGGRFDHETMFAVEEYADEVAGKLRSAFTTFARRYPSEPAVTSIVLVGGGSMLTGLSRRLQASLDISIAYGLPDKSFGGDTKRALLHLTAAGLGTGATG